MIGRYDVIVVGGGQAGLAMGWHLARQGRSFLILDAAARVGDAWRSRWSSLTLFTPACKDALPGMAFPAEPDHLPHKDEVAGYLERYAYVFGLPIRSGEPALAVRPVPGDGFEVVSMRGVYHADQVVIATGPFQEPSIPGVARALPEGIFQLHSSAYRDPAQLPDGGAVLVVGAGNSGVQIAAELAQTRETWLAVGEPLPRLPTRVLGRSLFSWLERIGAMDVSVDSRLGRRMSMRDFLIGESPRDAAHTRGVRLAGRVVRVQDGGLLTADGARLEPAAVVWATGYRMDFRFVDAPVFDERGRPVHRRGATAVPGLYFLGLPWQHTRGSALLGWVGRDAQWLADRIGERAVRGVTPGGRPRTGLAKTRALEPV